MFNLPHTNSRCGVLVEGALFQNSNATVLRDILAHHNKVGDPFLQRFRCRRDQRKPREIFRLTYWTPCILNMLPPQNYGTLDSDVGLDHGIWSIRLNGYCWTAEEGDKTLLDEKLEDR